MRRHIVELQNLEIERISACFRTDDGVDKGDLLATVSSLMLSKTSNASTSFSKESRRFSNVLVRIVSGLFPVNVCGSRVTRDIKGYGTYPSHETTTSGAVYQFEGHHVGDSGQTHPHLVHFIVLIPEDQVVRSEMEGADVGSIQLGTDDPLDLFRNSRQNENSDRPQDHGPRVRIEANLCDSNFVHVGAAREREFRACASCKQSSAAIRALNFHTSHESGIITKRIFGFPNVYRSSTTHYAEDIQKDKQPIDGGKRGRIQGIWIRRSPQGATEAIQRERRVKIVHEKRRKSSEEG